MFNFEKKERSEGTYVPEWLQNNLELVFQGNRIPEIGEKGKDVLEYAHIMLKPEALSAIQKGYDLDTFSRIETLAKSAGMLVAPWQNFTLNEQEIEQMYQKELSFGWITRERVDSLVRWPTAHLIIIGPNSRIISTIIRGRVSCRGRENCFLKFLPPGQEIVIPDIIKNCPPESLPEKAWAMGCGARLEMIQSGILIPQDSRKNDTEWNMVHASTPSDEYVNDFVKHINQLPQGRFYQSISELPIIPDFRTK